MTKTIRYQILANLTGNFWSALLALIFVPLYVRFLGIEAYGLIGFYATLQSVLALLDLGVTPTVNRELARHVGRPDPDREPRDLVRTFEAVYWALGGVLGGAVAAAAGVLSTSWIRANDLDPGEVRQAIAMMGVATAVQWPLTLYQGGLLGLQRSVLLQGVNATAATIRGVGSVLVLWLISPTVTAFFLWQALSAALHTSAVAYCLWRVLPSAAGPTRFRASLVRSRWRFAAGVSATSTVALMLSQLDKIVLSKLASLELFGYYVLAGTIADALYKLVTPINATLFPQFSSLVARHDEPALVALYHRSCQLVSVIAVPAAATLGLFSRELIWLWTRDAQLVNGAAPIVRVLIIGTALNGVMSLPYAAQLAHGWVRLGLFVNLSALAIVAPATILLAITFGAVGAAAGWVMLNAWYVCVAIPFMHRRILTGQMRRWYLVDVLLPSAVAVLVVTASRWAMPAALPPLVQATALVLTFALAASAAAAAAPDIRTWLISFRRERRVWIG